MENYVLRFPQHAAEPWVYNGIWKYHFIFMFFPKNQLYVCLSVWCTIYFHMSVTVLCLFFHFHFSHLTMNACLWIIRKISSTKENREDEEDPRRCRGAEEKDVRWKKHLNARMRNVNVSLFYFHPHRSTQIFFFFFTIFVNFLFHFPFNAISFLFSRLLCSCFSPVAVVVVVVVIHGIHSGIVRVKLWKSVSHSVS